MLTMLLLDSVLLVSKTTCVCVCVCVCVCSFVSSVGALYLIVLVLW